MVDYPLQKVHLTDKACVLSLYAVLLGICH